MGHNAKNNKVELMAKIIVNKYVESIHNPNILVQCVCPRGEVLSRYWYQWVARGM
jgi:hypothetical protein